MPFPEFLLRAFKSFSLEKINVIPTVPQGTNAFYPGKNHKDIKLYGLIFCKPFYSLILCLEESRVQKSLLCATTMRRPAGDIYKSTINCLCAWCIRGFSALSHISNEVETKTCRPWGRGEIIREGWRGKLCWLPALQVLTDWSVQPEAGEVYLGQHCCCSCSFSCHQGTVCLQNILLVPGPSCEEQRWQRQELTSLADEQTLNRSPAPHIYLQEKLPLCWLWGEIE